MRTRLLSLAIVGVLSLSAQAQLASDRYSPINYIGRFTGFGYSDGYHSCKDGQCNTRAGWKNWDPMGVTYASPASSPPRTMVIRPMIAPPQQTFQRYYEVPQAMESNELTSQTMPSTPQSFQPSVQSPSSPPPQWNAAPRSTIEVVPPAPIQLPTQTQPSPSDMRRLEPAPAMRYDTLPAPPSVPSKKSPPETQSILRPSTFRY